VSSPFHSKDTDFCGRGDDVGPAMRSRPSLLAPELVQVSRTSSGVRGRGHGGPYGAPFPVRALLRGGGGGKGGIGCRETSGLGVRGRTSIRCDSISARPSSSFRSRAGSRLARLEDKTSPSDLTEPRACSPAVRLSRWLFPSTPASTTSSWSLGAL